VVVDELHMLRDSGRGLPLELLLCKLLLGCPPARLQIIAMSATMSGVPLRIWS
jgi:replicative superfamily II helicase